LNVNGFNDVRQIEIHTAEPLVHESSAFEVEMTTEKLKGHRSQGIRTGGITICSELHKLINPIWNKEELPEECKESIFVPTDTKGDKTLCSR